MAGWLDLVYVGCGVSFEMRVIFISTGASEELIDDHHRDRDGTEQDEDIFPKF